MMKHKAGSRLQQLTLPSDSLRDAILRPWEAWQAVPVTCHHPRKTGMWHSWTNSGMRGRRENVCRQIAWGLGEAFILCVCVLKVSGGVAMHLSLSILSSSGSSFSMHLHRLTPGPLQPLILAELGRHHLLTFCPVVWGTERKKPRVLSAGKPKSSVASGPQFFLSVCCHTKVPQDKDFSPFIYIDLCISLGLTEWGEEQPCWFMLRGEHSFTFTESRGHWRVSYERHCLPWYITTDCSANNSPFRRLLTWTLLSPM